jgi:hypothetical protein
MALPPVNNPTVPSLPSAPFPPSPPALPCGFALPALPKFKFGFTLPPLPFPPNIPLPFIAFKLSCNLSSPIDVTGGLKLPFGGGRVNNAPPDPDLDETT